MEDDGKVIKPQIWERISNWITSYRRKKAMSRSRKAGIQLYKKWERKVVESRKKSKTLTTPELEMIYGLVGKTSKGRFQCPNDEARMIEKLNGNIDLWRMIVRRDECPLKS